MPTREGGFFMVVDSGLLLLLAIPNQYFERQ